MLDVFLNRWWPVNNPALQTANSNFSVIVFMSDSLNLNEISTMRSFKNTSFSIRLQIMAAITISFHLLVSWTIGTSHHFLKLNFMSRICLFCLRKQSCMLLKALNVCFCFFLMNLIKRTVKICCSASSLSRFTQQCKVPSDDYDQVNGIQPT